MAILMILGFLILTSLLAPIVGADSRNLAGRGNRRQFPLLPDEESLPA
jgi:hypothetical protein